jgi:hypothetical protein
VNAARIRPWRGAPSNEAREVLELVVRERARRRWIGAVIGVGGGGYELVACRIGEKLGSARVPERTESCDPGVTLREAEVLLDVRRRRKRVAVEEHEEIATRDRRTEVARRRRASRLAPLDDAESVVREPALGGREEIDGAIHRAVIRHDHLARRDGLKRERAKDQP